MMLAIMKRITLLLVSACSSTHPAHQPDGSVDMQIGEPFTVTVTYSGSPTYLAYRDGNGAWQKPSPELGVYTLQVTGPYEIAVACLHPSGSATSKIIARTPADGSTYESSCNEVVTPPTYVTATGTMKQPGSVSFGGDFTSGTTANWSASMMFVATGDDDLIAIGGGRVLVQRDHQVTGATALGTIDTAAGSALQPLQLTLAGMQSGDMPSTDVSLDTAHGSADLGTGTTTSVQVLPASALQSTDKEHLYVGVTNGPTVRSAYVDTFTGQSNVTLPPALAGVMFALAGTVLDASWQTLPTFDSAELLVFGNQATQTRLEYVWASKSWIDASSTPQLALAFPPDFDPTWLFDTTIGFSAYFDAFQNDPSGTSIEYDSGTSQDFNGGAQRMAPHELLSRVRAARISR